MNLPCRLQRWGIVALTVSPMLVGFAPLSSQPSLKATEISLQFPNTGNRGAPRTTAGGGTRSDDMACLPSQEGKVPLVALMPNRENRAKTANKKPNFYVYVPATTATEGEFVIVDDNNQEVYYTQFNLPSQPGIIKLSIPEQAGLMPGKSYSWSFMVICDSRYRNRDKVVEGVMEYINLDSEVENQLKTASSLEKAEIYAKSALWFETLAAMAPLKTSNPSQWRELLKSVGLETLADVPLLDCCQPKN